MVTFIKTELIILYLLEMNCKLIANWLLKSLCLYINDVRELTMFRKYTKIFFVHHYRCWGYCKKENYADLIFIIF